MSAMGIMGGMLVTALISGCATMDGASGPHGPRLVGSGRTTETGHYAEIGVEFSSPGDFFALVSPSRWKSPVATGGSLSWLNPSAWSEDAGRTARILAGEAVVVGGAVIASSGGGAGSDGVSSGTEGSGGSVPSDGGSSGGGDGPPTVPGGPPI